MVTREAEAAKRRAPLSRPQILQAAVAIADRGGLDALSMRRLGQDLGVDPMAIYRHVRNKDDLLEGVVEAIVGQIEAPRSGEDWQATIRTQAMAARRVMLRHPWARRVLEDRVATGTWIIAYVDAVLATLRGGGFSVDLAHHALHVLGSRIFGFNQDVIDDAGPPLPPEAAAVMTRVLAGYPNAAELARTVSHDGVLGPCDDDFEFAFGLDLILDGLERLRRAS